MQVNKSDIMIFFEEREIDLKKRIEELRKKACEEKTMVFDFECMEIRNRLTECLYIKEIISLMWNIIHQKKG